MKKTRPTQQEHTPSTPIYDTLQTMIEKVYSVTPWGKVETKKDAAPSTISKEIHPFDSLSESPFKPSFTLPCLQPGQLRDGEIQYRDVVLDVETTGLPRTRGFNSYYSPEQHEYYDTSRIVQVGLYSPTESHEWTICPDNFQIENAHIHGISQAKALKGVYWKTFEIEFLSVLGRYSRLIGHNIMFDLHVLSAEFSRRGNNQASKALFQFPNVDTMKKGKEYLGWRKSPKLTELYVELFRTQFNQTHTALEDCKATWQCFQQLP